MCSCSYIVSVIIIYIVTVENQLKIIANERHTSIIEWINIYDKHVYKKILAI